MPFWSAIWSGFMGRWFFRLASRDLPGVGVRVTSSAEPTETLIADAADAVFARLPAQDRRRLSDVPAAIHHLQAQVQALRRRGAELERAFTRAGVDQSTSREQSAEQGSLPAAELKAAAQAVGERLATAIAALENLRLDLMRLQTGQGSTDDFTADLEAAREIGEEIDRLLAGQREVADMLEAEETIPR